MHWRTHPQLAGKFHPEHPDDLQVLVHDGGPRFTTTQPEAVWVTITAYEDNVFVGRVLNKPLQLRTVAQGDQIRFLVPANSELPVLVSQKYLSERPHWKINPCTQCGCDELFDAPSDLIKAIFPDVPPGASMEMITSFCPLCGGVQVLEPLNAPSPSAQGASQSKKWWQFWK